MKTNVQRRILALGEPSRLAILDRLAKSGRPLPVVDIAKGLPISRSAVSQHLKILKLAGLVVDRPAANRRLYQIQPQGLAELRDCFNEFWQESLRTFKRAVETQEEDP